MFFGDKDTPFDSRPPIPWVPELDTDGAALLTDLSYAGYKSFTIHKHLQISSNGHAHVCPGCLSMSTAAV